MVDVGGKCCAAGGYLLTDKFRSDVRLYAKFAAVHVLADGNIFHFGSDDTLLGIVHLCYLTAFLCAVRKLYVLEAQMVEAAVGKTCLAILGADFGQTFHVARTYPLLTQTWKALAQVYFGIRVAVCAAGVVDVDRSILGHYLFAFFHDYGWGEFHAAHADAHVGVEFALHVNLLRVGIGNFNFLFHKYMVSCYFVSCITRFISVTGSCARRILPLRAMPLRPEAFRSGMSSAVTPPIPITGRLILASRMLPSRRA